MSWIEKPPRLLVFAGPNGSGKSTVTRSEKIVGEYVNADLIKERKACTNLEAAQEAERVRERLLGHRIDFTFETVLSTPRNLLLLQKAKNAGYQIKVIFVLTKDPEINVLRVAERVKKGGHDVPPEKIRSRYYRSLDSLKSLYRIVDTLFIYDNSGEEPVLICSVQEKRLTYYPNEQWGKEEVLKLFI